MLPTSISASDLSHAESARERANRHNEERAAQRRRAQPWKVAAAILFGGWLVAHAWFWHQRGLRPRVANLDGQLTVLRYLSAGAFLWVLLYTPLDYLVAKLSSWRKSHDGEVRPLRSSEGLEEHSNPRRFGLFEEGAWVLPCLSAVVAVSLIFTLGGFLLGMGMVGIVVAIALLPWLPVVFILRRAFPGGRSELVMASLLLFFAVGLGQSVFNRGFYKWNYHFGSIEFVVPHQPR